MNPVDKTLVIEHQFVVTSDNTDYTFDYAINPKRLLQSYVPDSRFVLIVFMT